MWWSIKDPAAAEEIAHVRSDLSGPVADCVEHQIASYVEDKLWEVAQ